MIARNVWGLVRLPGAAGRAHLPAHNVLWCARTRCLFLDRAADHMEDHQGRQKQDRVDQQRPFERDTASPRRRRFGLLLVTFPRNLSHIRLKTFSRLARHGPGQPGGCDQVPYPNRCVGESMQS